ncbi:MAG: hypothetical protein VYA71_06845 [Pseudomonadota bacterium]|nr:hypothetical protein [Pseudomonadota bacterium]
MVVSLLLIGLLYYGHADDAVTSLFGGVPPGGLFTALWAAFFVVAIGYLVVRRPGVESLTKLCNAFALGLVLLPLGTVAVGLAGDTSPPVPMVEPSAASPGQGQLTDPDIYYIIFDRYAGERTLRDVYDYDNRDFLESLRERQFFVIDRSRANYTKTAHSLAATLNLTHLAYLSEQIGPGSGDWKPVYGLMLDSKVMRDVKARGYRYLHFGSWWEPTRRNRLADENYFAPRLLPWFTVDFNEFESLLLRQTLPVRVSLALFGGDSGWRRHQFKRVGRKLDQLATLRRRDGPLFVFAHMLIPHDPFVFHADGRYKSPAEAGATTRERNYVDQLIYTNRRIQELVDQLLAKSPPPVIIIQADEGPFPQRYHADEDSFDWSRASDEEMRKKFGILNAIYFPDGDYSALYQGMTPINSFPVVFNKYFGETYAMLPDTSYTFRSHDDLYTFLDITETVK